MMERKDCGGRIESPPNLSVCVGPSQNVIYKGLFSNISGAECLISKSRWKGTDMVHLAFWEEVFNDFVNVWEINLSVMYD